MIMKIVNVKINNDFGKTLYFSCLADALIILLFSNKVLLVLK
jgi:hypothetical protein